MLFPKEFKVCERNFSICGLLLTKNFDRTNIIGTPFSVTMSLDGMRKVTEPNIANIKILVV